MKLLHLYDDVMNLYGEYANVSVLARYLSDLGCEVQVDTLSLYDEAELDGYDFYFMGAGTERRQKLALERLLGRRDTLKKLIAEGKVMLFTGNSFELLGKSVTDADGKTYEALGLFDFTTVETKRRITGDCIACCDMPQTTAVGFMNKCSRTSGIQTPLFSSLEMGFGNEEDKGPEGLREGNCFGTHLTGPLLVKNPALLRYVAALLGVEGSVDYPYMDRAYETTLSELRKRLELMKK